jgi:peptidoglycan/xylan/chitin deacetylase (PgdA/CDA1 family)
MIKTAKQVVLHTCRNLGVFELFYRSRWRRSRLLVLAYHGISIDDEHLWNPTLYMSPQMFRLRMELIRRSGCSVLPLGEAIRRLYEFDLPPKSTAITVDDGFYDFYARAYPVLEQYAYPVTVYQTTYYCEYNRPVFDLMCSYLLWKGSGAVIEGLEFTGRRGPLDLSTPAKRTGVWQMIYDFAQRSNFSAADKDDLLCRLADKLNLDYPSLLDRRLLHLMNPGEIQTLAGKGVDLQLHTHRHRTPRLRGALSREIQENKAFLDNLTGGAATHFCYPSGEYAPEFVEWLAESGVTSATTCDPGLASNRSHPFFLPRLVDTSLLADVEFEGWLCGVSQLIRGARPNSHRAYVASP